MTERPGTLELVARELAAAVAPLEQHLAGGNAEEFIAGFGIRLPGGMAQAAAAFSATAVKAGGAATALARLTDAIDDEDTARIVAEGIATINTLAQAFAAIGGIGPALSDAVSASAGLTPAQRTRLLSEVAALPGRLLQTVMADYVETRNGDLFAGLRAAGLIDDVVVDGDPSDPTSVAGTPPRAARGPRADHALEPGAPTCARRPGSATRASTAPSCGRGSPATSTTPNSPSHSSSRPASRRSSRPTCCASPSSRADRRRCPPACASPRSRT